jgi:diguanylate cyclase (GGDEF)-like protein
MKPKIARRTGVESLAEVVQDLSLATELREVQRVVRVAARRLTGADGATLVLREGERCYYADEDAISPLWKGKRFPLDHCISGWVISHRAPAVIPDIYADERVPHEAYRPTFVKSLAMVPIRQIEPLGAIGNYWAVSRKPTREEVSLLQAIADSTAVAMESIGIRELSIRDELTGVLNRRGFFAEAEGRLTQSRGSGSHLSLVFADLDGVKRVNDERGHGEGDRLIRAGAEVLRDTLGGDALIGRLGGDEFVALSREPVAAASLQAEIREQARRLDHGIPPLSISVGVAAASPDEERSLDELIHEADRQMLEKKPFGLARRQPRS